jgi:hypothetical protein
VGRRLRRHFPTKTASPKCRWDLERHGGPDQPKRPSLNWTYGSEGGVYQQYGAFLDLERSELMCYLGSGHLTRLNLALQPQDPFSGRRVQNLLYHYPPQCEYACLVILHARHVVCVASLDLGTPASYVLGTRCIFL